MNFLGFDFGASSGRAMLGRMEDGRIRLEEIHRFSNDPVMLAGRMVWDLPRLIFEMKRALTKVGQMKVKISGIGIDTWGVDFGLLDANGHLISLPVHYRDARNARAAEHALKIMPQKELFAHTGIAYNSFNTVFQLYAMKEEDDPALSSAKQLLFMPDLLAYCLTGSVGTEYTIASTSQLLSSGTGQWCREIFDRLGQPIDLMGSVEAPGALRGMLLNDIAGECGIVPVPVYAVAGHDTASAVAAVPAKDRDFAYLSSGTWSLLGVETDEPILTENVLNANYTNEGGADGRIRLLKNIMGLWIQQECKRTWDREGEVLDFAEYSHLASQERPLSALIDVDDPIFLPPGDMPARAQSYCERSGQAVPETRAQITRVVCEGLALKYRWAVERLVKDILGRRVSEMYVVGGGSRNQLLNQMTADALNRPVIAGPSEATVIGNLLMQAKAAGAVSDIRAVVEASFPTQTLHPEDVSAWDDAYARYLDLTERNGRTADGV